MTTKNISELDDFDNHIINIINQSKSEKRADVDAILNQIMKINDCLDVNINFLSVCLNYLLKHNIVVKKIYQYRIMKKDRHLMI